MVIGDINKIDLGTSHFSEVIRNNNLYVDKTKMIEHFLNESSKVNLICRQRRIGKSLNMDTLRCFLTDKEDNRRLFDGLYIQNSPVWIQVNSSPVFVFDFKNINAHIYKENLCRQVYLYMSEYCDVSSLDFMLLKYIQGQNLNDTNGLLYLTETVFKATDKRSYILIDEYDKTLMDNFGTEKYEEIRTFLTHFFSAGLKGNPYLEKALLTGVTRISQESMFSDLNNIEVFDVFSDKVYTDDYGLTELEIDELDKLIPFNKEELKNWYNGIMINGKAIYNTYSTMSFLKSQELKNYWQMSGTMDIIIKLLNSERIEVLIRVFSGEYLQVPIKERLSLKDLFANNNDRDFYSLLVQAGYLALDKEGKVSIPNIELNYAWNEFIMDRVFNTNEVEINNIFKNYLNPAKFAEDFEKIFNNRLSNFDFLDNKNYEKTYHLAVLFLLCAYGDDYNSLPKSNQELGNGRYDILVTRKEAFYIVELKVSKSKRALKSTSLLALEQINKTDYSSGLIESKPIIKIGMAFHKKLCKVACEVDDVKNAEKDR